jgi:flagellar biosynthetic protein FliR
MHTEVSINFALLYSFMIVLARVSGFLLLVPLPGLNAGPNTSRVVLAVTLTACLLPLGPAIRSEPLMSDLVLWIAAEFAFGLVIGVGLAFLLEGFQVAGQAVGLQAGFSYASTVDPSTQADTAVLQTVLQLFTGILFFTLGLHLQLIRLLTIGLDVVPTAAAVSKAFSADAAMRLGSLMFGTGLRLAMPVMGAMILVDLAFALLSKVHSQLQLHSFSFAVKMLASLALFAMTLSLYPAVLGGAAAHTFEILRRLLT